MNDVLGNLSARIGDEFSHPLMDARGDERYLVVLMTADKGLAGAFNANLIKAGQQFLRDNTGKTVEMMPVGRKGRDFFRRRSITFLSEHVGLTGGGQVNINDAKEIAQNIIRTFTEDETIDKVFLIFSEFKSVLSQRVVVEQLLPVVGKSDEGDAGAAPDVDYIYEQEPGELFSRLLPRLVETQIYRGMLESVASEQGARMTAMDSASKNAGELIDSLTLNMNRIRQAAITKEIIEVVSGAAAL
jgi:F-type H+-transporting ATPase subunit gamma